MADTAPPAPALTPKSGKPILPLVVVVFALLGAILMGASLTMTWYTSKVEGGPNPYTADENFGGYVTNGQSQDWGSMANVTNSHAMYGQVEGLVAAGLVTSLFLVVGGAMVMMNPKWKTVAALFGVLAIVFTLLGPVVFIARHQPAWAEDAGSSVGAGPQNTFAGTSTSSGVTQTWGPNAGLAAAVLGFVFALLGAIVVFFVKGAPRKA